MQGSPRGAGPADMRIHDILRKHENLKAYTSTPRAGAKPAPRSSPRPLGAPAAPQRPSLAPASSYAAPASAAYAESASAAADVRLADTWSSAAASMDRMLAEQAELRGVLHNAVDAARHDREEAGLQQQTSRAQAAEMRAEVSRGLQLHSSLWRVPAAAVS